MTEGFAGFRSSPSSTKIRRSASAKPGWGPDVPAGEKLSPEESRELRVRFRQLLLHKHHTLVGAWTAMDTKLQGRLSFYQFCAASRDLGVYDAARKTWSAFDHDRQGFISLYEVHEPTARLLESFAICVWAACGSVQAAWEKHFNRRGLGRCSPESFAVACKEIGFSGDTDAVYNALNSEQCLTSIGQDQFHFISMWFATKRPADKVSAFHPHIDQETAELRAQVAAAAKPKAATRVAGQRHVTAKDRFKRLLLNAFDNYVRAWREGLDYDKNGRLDYEEFRTCCADIGYPGPRKELWDELDVNGSGEVSLEEIDEPTAKMLKSFYMAVMERYDSWDEAWLQHFDLRGTDRVEIGDFRDACLTLAWAGNVERLFDCLDTERTKYLTYKSCSWIAGEDSPDKPSLFEEVGDFKISGKFKKYTKAQQRRLDQIQRDDRVRQRRFEARNRGEIIPDPNKQAVIPAFHGASSMSLSAPAKPQATPKGVSESSALITEAGGSISPYASLSLSSAHRPGRFAHSAELYYTRDPYPGPPPAPAPQISPSAYRRRLNGQGKRVPLRQPSQELSQSHSLPMLSRVLSEAVAAS